MTEAKNLWGGRFTEKTDETFAEFNNSFSFDRRLFFVDVQASIAHCDALFHAGVLTRLESERIKNGLQTILKRADYDKNYFDELPSEDVHSFIEARLVQLIGDAGRKLHTGRSRNDQVTTAFRLWLREEIEEISKIVRLVQKTLIEAAEKQRDAVLPGYTHLQRAQPILWAHWCLAYFEMFSRDRERLDEVWRRVNVLPLGSAALAGTSYEIDREEVARQLGFEGVSANSLDAVSDRDFAVELVGACSLVMVHLSRLSEDLILYASSEFQFIELSDAVSTGSSLMPQKKNPDALELIRGKAGRVFGHQIALLTTLKGLPMAYNKDLQEDKEAVFDTVDTIKICLQAAAIVLKNLHVNEEKTREAATKGYLNATELADYLVQKDVPFRTAHDTVGKIVMFAISQDKELNDLDLSDMRNFSEQIEKDVFEALSLEQTLANKNQIGGTAPERVFEALDGAKESLAREEN
ncbi:MAG: argininosuccinate lyase [Acidobacteria bacterium]|jgi:argininosuccinate lyase|nr:argininosuccinate lyase [Acidobacteriota bacterium]